MIKDTIARVHAGAREAGRTRATSTYGSRRARRSTTTATARPGREGLGALEFLNHSMRFGLDNKHLPDELRAKIQEYVDGYELYDHVLHEGRNPRRMEAARPDPVRPRSLRAGR